MLCEIPNTYGHGHVLTLRAHKNAHKQLAAIRKQGNKHRGRMNVLNKLIAGTLAGKFPHVSNVAIEQIIHMGAVLYSSEIGMCNVVDENSIIKFDGITGILPSRTSINDYCIETAAHKIIMQGKKMKQAKALFIAADKGGGVLAKVLSYWDEDEKRIVSVHLDFDTTGDDAKGGGAGIKHSLSKYIFDDTLLKIKGTSSDSGGGFTGDVMVKALCNNGLADKDNIIHVNRTEHNDQIALRNGILEVYGPGGLDLRNIAQLVHAFSDIQTSFHGGGIELLPLMIAAYRYVHMTDPPHDFLLLMQEPILTRWKTLGEAFRYVNNYFDVLIIFGEAICAMKDIKKILKLENVQQITYHLPMRKRLRLILHLHLTFIKFFSIIIWSSTIQQIQI